MDGVIYFRKREQQEQKHKGTWISDSLCIVLHIKTWVTRKKYLSEYLGIQVESGFESYLTSFIFKQI